MRKHWEQFQELYPCFISFKANFQYYAYLQKKKKSLFSVE